MTFGIIYYTGNTYDCSYFKEAKSMHLQFKKISTVLSSVFNIQLTFQSTLINSSSNSGPPYEMQTCTSCAVHEYKIQYIKHKNVEY